MQRDRRGSLDAQNRQRWSGGIQRFNNRNRRGNRAKVRSEFFRNQADVEGAAKAHFAGSRSLQGADRRAAAGMAWCGAQTAHIGRRRLAGVMMMHHLDVPLSFPSMPAGASHGTCRGREQSAQEHAQQHHRAGKSQPHAPTLPQFCPCAKHDDGIYHEISRRLRCSPASSKKWAK